MAYKPRCGIGSATDIYQMPAVAMPAWRGSFVDPVFGTVITRMSDLSQSPVSTPTPNNAIIYEYPPAVPISKDKTWITMFARGGTNSGWGGVFRVSDGALMSSWISPGNAMESGFHWSPTNDNIGWFQSNRWSCRIDMPSGTITQLYRPTRADGSQFTYSDARGNGSVSHTNRWHAFHASTYQSALPNEWQVYDRLSNSLYKRIDAPDYTAGLFPAPYSGLVVAGGDTETHDTKLYDIDFNYIRRLSRLVSHGDVALGSGGDEYYLYMAQLQTQRDDVGWWGFTKVRLSDGLTTKVPGFDGGPIYAYHISGCISYSHPGWCVLSHYSDVLPSPFIRPGEHEVWLWNFETGEVRRLAHTHNTPEVGKDYWSETQASSSWDGNAILFKSNWGAPTIDRQVHTYMITPPTGSTFWQEEILQTTSRKNWPSDHWAAKRW